MTRYIYLLLLAGMIIPLMVQCQFYTGEDESLVPPDINVQHEPDSSTTLDSVLVTAEVSDTALIDSIEIYVNHSKVYACPPGPQCRYQLSDLSSGTYTYHAGTVSSHSKFDQVKSRVKEFVVTEAAKPPTTPPEGEVKVMPLGDSITEAFGYRIPLWNQLTDAGYEINYVGSQTEPHPDLPDPRHEGHGGWYIGHIAENVNDWLAAYEPDYILLMIGTNDVAWWNPNDGATIAEDHAALVDQILQNSPDATQLLVASIPPQSSELIGPNDVDRAELAKDFNEAMEQQMRRRIEDDQPITFVDMHSPLSVDMLPDGIHPDSEGYNIIAEAWLNALMPTLP